MSQIIAKNGENLDEIFEPYLSGTTQANITNIQINGIDLNQRYLAWDGINTADETNITARKNPTDTTLTDLDLIFSKKNFAEVGTVIIWPTATIPEGYLLCNGQAVSRTTYSILFSVISTIYGVGNGSTTFNIPNMNNFRMPYYTDITGFGQIGGSQNVTLDANHIPSHTHGVGNIQGASHNHNILYSNAARQWFSGANNNNNNAATNGNRSRAVNCAVQTFPRIANPTPVITLTGNSDFNTGPVTTTLDILNQFIGVNYIIRY
jgi:microcystin-dependent protein